MLHLAISLGVPFTLDELGARVYLKAITANRQCLLRRYVRKYIQAGYLRREWKRRQHVFYIPTLLSYDELSDDQQHIRDLVDAERVLWLKRYNSSAEFFTEILCSI